MYKVKTFGTEVEVFHAHTEFARLDQQVNEFLTSHPRVRLLGASDTAIADETGATVGMVRVVSYEE